MKEHEKFENNQKFTIEQATMDDIDAIIRIQKELLISTYSGITSDVTKEVMEDHVNDPSWEEKKRIYWQESLADSHHAGVFIAKSGNEVTGFSETIIDSTNTRWISALYVLQQGKGIGKELLRRTLEFHPSNVEIFVRVVPGIKAVTFYEHMGFKPITQPVSQMTLKGGQQLPQIGLALSK